MQGVMREINDPEENPYKMQNMTIRMGEFAPSHNVTQNNPDSSVDGTNRLNLPIRSDTIAGKTRPTKPPAFMNAGR